MNSSLLYRSGMALAVITLFLSLSSPVLASPLTIDQPFQHAGLTFTEPLSFTDQSAFHLKTRLLVFAKAKTISVILNPTTEPDIDQLPTTSPLPSVQPTLTVAKKLLPSEPSPTPSPLPTTPPLPTVQPTTSQTPTPITSLANMHGLNADTLFTMANDYRVKKNLSALQKDERSCSLAASRAPEIAAEIASDTMHSGLRSRNLSYWNTENIISMRSETEAFNWWINDTIHREAIEGNYTYSCVACSGNSCAQEFTNYQPK